MAKSKNANLSRKFITCQKSMNFGNMIEGIKVTKYKQFLNGKFVQLFKRIFKFFNFDSKFLKKNAPSYPIDIYIVFDKVRYEEQESEVKTGTGSSFGRHFDEKPFLGDSRWHFRGQS